RFPRRRLPQEQVQRARLRRGRGGRGGEPPPAHARTLGAENCLPIHQHPLLAACSGMTILCHTSPERTRRDTVMVPSLALRVCVTQQCQLSRWLLTVTPPSAESGRPCGARSSAPPFAATGGARRSRCTSRACRESP